MPQPSAQELAATRTCSKCLLTCLLRTSAYIWDCFCAAGGDLLQKVLDTYIGISGSTFILCGGHIGNFVELCGLSTDKSFSTQETG